MEDLKSQRRKKTTATHSFKLNIIVIERKNVRQLEQMVTTSFLQPPLYVISMIVSRENLNKYEKKCFCVLLF